MTSEYLLAKAAETGKRYGRQDPFRLAEKMGILMLREPMGTAERACKGFFMIIARQPVIAVNADLTEDMQRIVVMHEIGHAVLHRNKAALGFHDYELFDTVSKSEYEANVFAAEYMLADEDVLEKLHADLSFFQAAAALRVPPEFLSFKFRMMKQKGTLVIDSPILADSTFLKRAVPCGSADDGR